MRQIGSVSGAEEGEEGCEGAGGEGEGGFGGVGEGLGVGVSWWGFDGVVLFLLVGG